ncbi:MAG: hypothetical protein EOP07_14185 [Proteobacteria bacterium]|nr:MAG: hypothetical protein EOP07_14185 [Pseudomonadota bacterium]
MKHGWLILLFTLSCSDPAARNTLRTQSDGQKSVVPEPSEENSSSGDSATAPVPNPVPDNKTQVPPTEENGTSVELEVKGISCSSSAVIAKTKKICEATVQGIKVKFVPLAEGVKVSRLAFYLHGDTAADWKNPFVVAPFVEWAASKQILLVMPLSTARYEDDKEGDQSYGAAQPEDAEKLAKLVGEFVAAYKTPSDNLLYFGTSGGPWFMASSYIPVVGGRYPGLFALSCGASTFWQKALWSYKDSSIRSKIKIFFNYGDKDFLLSGEEKSYAYYETQGFVVSKKVYPGATHCNHDVTNATIAFWEANM